MNGKLIVFEGPDGSGKTTILKKVNQQLSKQGYKLMLVREPGGTEISEKIREIIIDNDNVNMSAKTESLLFAASRAQLIDEKIRPGLENGKIILTYQGVGRGLGIEEVKAINDFATDNIRPDLTIFFNIDYKTALVRKRENFSADRLENEDFNFHKKIFDAYLDIAQKYNRDIKQVDATRSIEEVSSDVLNLIKDLLED